MSLPRYWRRRPCWAFFIFVWDAHAAGEDPETYERVHRISAEEYIHQSYLGAGVAGAVLLVPVLFFVDGRRRRVWRVLVYGIAAAFLVMAAVGWWRWAGTGFDH